MSEVKINTAELLAVAQLLDDCLVRIYPDEFTEGAKKLAAIRFAAGGGTINRIAGASEKIRSVVKERAGK